MKIKHKSGKNAACALMLCGVWTLFPGEGRAVAVGEPTNAKEAVKQQQQASAITPEMLDREARRRAAMTPEQLAWEETLEANLGNFYLPAYYHEKDAGRETAWDYVKDDPALPRLLIIGDSISRGYTVAVRHVLAGKFNVHRAPANCGPTALGLKNLAVWLGKSRWDVITWNFGIHDRKTDAAEYQKNLIRLYQQLRATGAKLIWVRTTPAPPPGINDTVFSDAQCEQVNRVADGIMQANSIPEVDLYGLMKPRLREYQNPNDVHFRDSGYQIMGQEVARVVLIRYRAAGAMNGSLPVGPNRSGH
jgi:lysophospholipase L1-like esterase